MNCILKRLADILSILLYTAADIIQTYAWHFVGVNVERNISVALKSTT